MLYKSIKRPFSFFLSILLIGIMVGCTFQKKDEALRKGQPPIKTMINLDKGTYNAGGIIDCSIKLENRNDKSISIEALELEIKSISKGSSSLTKKLEGLEIKWKNHETKNVNVTFNIPEHFDEGAYGVYITQKEKGFRADTTYESFFRITAKDELTVFKIETQEVADIPIYTLNGGMSAEYIIEKAAENLTSGISHSWEVNAPGSGPNHVLGTPNFLEKSVEQTVSFYDGTLGANRSIETVLVTPGFTSIPYISKSLNAVVLPLHFLVSVNTVKEIETILKTANSKDISSYATLSHDPSVPYAVAWVKLLSLPDAYTDFLKRHRVRNLVIMGATGTSGGETKAKQLIDDSNTSGEYAEGSIYIMYPGTSPDDVETLNTKIVDLKDFKQQDEYIQIADWESGINPVQIQNFAAQGKSIPDVNVSTLLAEDLGHLYNLGTYTTIALMAKNKKQFEAPKGVIFNPYLIAHPSYELKEGYVPLLYWQLVGADYTVDRMEHCAIKGINHYFPSARTENLQFWLNSTRNFGASWSADNLRKELKKRGFTNIKEGDYNVDEVWNLNDGMDSPSELIFSDLQSSGYKNFKKWSDSLVPLNLTDIKNISEKFGGFEIEQR